MHHEAIQHLSRADRQLARIIKQVGDCKLRPARDRSLFHTLVNAVANQQLSGKAAQTILGRFQAMFPGKKFPTPEQVLAAPGEKLRECGFSRAKVAAIRDIAAKAIDGTIPSPRALARLKDEEIIERLTSIRGVGQWTVEMLLIFKLGRSDVFPVTDLGIRKGFALVYGHEELLPPKKLMELGEHWRPYRSIASWYLWRSLDVKAEQDGAG